MRWIPFVILCYIAAAFQVAGLGLLAPHGPYPIPQYIILVAVFYAMYAADDAAALVGLICGVLLDMTSSNVPGTLAIPLALTCCIILKIRLSVFREHGISQCIITGLAVITFAVLALCVRWLLARIARVDSGLLVSWTYLGMEAANALYTALLAPVIFWLLLRMESFLGFGLRGPKTRHH